MYFSTVFSLFPLYARLRIIYIILIKYKYKTKTKTTLNNKKLKQKYKRECYEMVVLHQIRRLTPRCAAPRNINSRARVIFSNNRPAQQPFRAGSGWWVTPTTGSALSFPFGS